MIADCPRMLCPLSHSVKRSQTGSTELLGRYGSVFPRAFGTMKWELEKILSPLLYPPPLMGEGEPACRQAGVGVKKGDACWRMKWELKKILSLPIGDEKKDLKV